MNEFQTNLYNDLLRLTQERDAFYVSDFFDEAKNERYRIFLYRLASYTEFLMPNALECRGVMFRMDDLGNPVALVSLPFEKFFNWGENPMTMDVDFSTAVSIQEKRDGSLISTYVDTNENLCLKSKGSIFSQQVADATEWLDRPENFMLQSELEFLTLLNFTVIMEWTSPDNRIVVGYDKPSLTILAVRNNLDGSYVDKSKFLHFDAIDRAWVTEYIDRVADPQHFIQSIHQLNGIEGFVIVLADGQRVKIKTETYVHLHKMKDSINSPRNLFEAVIDEATDDLKALFVDDPSAIRLIVEMEEFAIPLFNEMCSNVENFYEKNKGLDRKSFAILGQEVLQRHEFSLAMAKFTGKSVDYKTAMKKRWKELGLKEELQISEGED